jgi:hypothetical protein
MYYKIFEWQGALGTLLAIKEVSQATLIAAGNGSKALLVHLSQARNVPWLDRSDACRSNET